MKILRVLTITAFAILACDLFCAEINNAHSCPDSQEILHRLEQIVSREEIEVYENDFPFANTNLENNSGSFFTHASMLKKYLEKGRKNGVLTKLTVRRYNLRLSIEFIEEKFGYPICTYTIGYGRCTFSQKQPGEVILVLRK